MFDYFLFDLQFVHNFAILSPFDEKKKNMNNKRFDKTFLGLFKKRNEIILHKNLQTIEKNAFNIYPFFLTFNITT